MACLIFLADTTLPYLEVPKAPIPQPLDPWACFQCLLCLNSYSHTYNHIRWSVPAGPFAGTGRFCLTTTVGVGDYVGRGISN